VRLTGAGVEWNQVRPYPVPTTDAQAPEAAIGGDAALASAPYAVKLYSVTADPDAPMVFITPGAGRLRAATDDGDLGVLTGGRWMCFGGKCQCPPGTDGEVPDHDNVSGATVHLALTGGNQAGSGSVSYHSLDEFCKPSDEGGGGGGGGAGGGHGGIDIYHFDDNGNGTIIGVISSGSCSFGGGAFKARGSGSGYTMTMRIGGAKKPGTFLIPYGSRQTFVTVGRYSSLNAPPNATSTGAVLVKSIRVKNKVRYRISLGYADLFAPGLGSAVALKPEPGGLVC
jgi:hypothetical protein